MCIRDRPVVMHTFEEGKVGKVSLVYKPVISEKPDSKCFLGGAVPKKVHHKLTPIAVNGAKSNPRDLEKPLTFVTSVAEDYSLEYANAWKSSLDFDVKKPQRPLFRITNSKSKRNSSKKNHTTEARTIVDANFSFSHNSLNKVAKSTKHSSVSFSSPPAFRVSLRDR